MSDEQPHTRRYIHRPAPGKQAEGFPCANPDNPIFEVTLSITPDCAEPLTPTEILAWVKDKFAGCDLGTVMTVGVQARPRIAHGPHGHHERRGDR